MRTPSPAREGAGGLRHLVGQLTLTRSIPTAASVHLWDIRRLSIPAARIRTHTEAAGGLCWCADPLLVSAAARVSSTAETSRQEPPGATCSRAAVCVPRV